MTRYEDICVYWRICFFFSWKYQVYRVDYHIWESWFPLWFTFCNVSPIFDSVWICIVFSYIFSDIKTGFQKDQALPEKISSTHMSDTACFCGCSADAAPCLYDSIVLRTNMFFKETYGTRTRVFLNVSRTKCLKHITKILWDTTEAVIRLTAGLCFTYSCSSLCFLLFSTWRRKIEWNLSVFLF